MRLAANSPRIDSRLPGSLARYATGNHTHEPLSGFWSAGELTPRPRPPA